MKEAKIKQRMAKYAYLNDFKEKLANKDEVLLKILELFTSKPDFQEIGDFKVQHVKTIESIQIFINKIIKQEKFLDVETMIKAGLLIIKRDSNHDIIPYDYNIEKPSSTEIVIR